MKPRLRMQIVADGDTVTLATPPVATPNATTPVPPPSAAGRFHALLIIEGAMTGDKRTFTENSLTWRDLPLPFMAHDENSPEHLGSILIANIDTIERKGLELHGYGPYLSNPSPEAARLIELVKSGELRGVSADIDDVEFEVLFPTTDKNGNPIPDAFEMLFDVGMTDVECKAQCEADGVDPNDPAAMQACMDTCMNGPVTPTENIDGVEYEVVPVQEPVLRVTEGRIMGATVEPFPAFQEAYIEDDSGAVTVAASAARLLAHEHVTGVILAAALDTTDRVVGRESSPSRFDFPDVPPREWFDVPETPGPMPLTILDSGQVFGHLAVWGECHVGISGECVEPPTSPSNYARFMVGEIPVDDGGRVAVGRLTYATGHADTRLGANAARSHYDDTGTVAADISAVDGAYGIWVCGAMRPGLGVREVREVMASPPSGDWRRFGRDLEMVGALCVNVPGFNVPRVTVRKEDGLIASLIVSHPAPPITASALPNVDAEVARRAIAHIARSVGRTPQARIAALAARVHGAG